MIYIKNPIYYYFWKSIDFCVLITNNVMMAFEMIHNMNNNNGRNDRNCAFKIDISKAYAMVQWDFLKGMFGRFEFVEK